MTPVCVTGARRARALGQPVLPVCRWGARALAPARSSQVFACVAHFKHAWMQGDCRCRAAQAGLSGYLAGATHSPGRAGRCNKRPI